MGLGFLENEAIRDILNRGVISTERNVFTTSIDEFYDKQDSSEEVFPEWYYEQDDPENYLVVDPLYTPLKRGTEIGASYYGDARDRSDLGPPRTRRIEDTGVVLVEELPRENVESILVANPDQEILENENVTVSATEYKTNYGVTRSTS